MKLVATMMGGLGGGGRVEMVQLDAMMQSPLYSTMLGGTEASLHALCGTAIRGGGVGTCWSAVWATLRVELPFRVHWGRDQTTT